MRMLIGSLRKSALPGLPANAHSLPSRSLRSQSLRSGLAIRFPALALLVTSFGCFFSSGEVPPAPAPAGLRPTSELVADCHDTVTKKDHATLALKLQTGDRAVDFELQDTDGAPVRLSSLLASKPVLLVQGSWTCPRFQQERMGLEETYKRFRDAIHIVVVYNIEAHPGGGDPSPYRGKPWPADFSDRGQPRTFEERLRNAQEIARDASMPVLVDKLGAPGSNPVWCTYGTCASCSWLIGQDGVIVAAHEWHDAPTMNASIEAVVAGASK
jgi:hypothetical protein